MEFIMKKLLFNMHFASQAEYNFAPQIF